MIFCRQEHQLEVECHPAGCMLTQHVQRNSLHTARVGSLYQSPEAFSFSAQFSNRMISDRTLETEHLKLCRAFLFFGPLLGTLRVHAAAP